MFLQSHWNPCYLLNEDNNLPKPIKMRSGQRYGWQRASEILGLYTLFIHRAQTVEISSGYGLKGMYSHLYRKHMAEFNLGVNKNTLKFHTIFFPSFYFTLFPIAANCRQSPSQMKSFLKLSYAFFNAILSFPICHSIYFCCSSSP